MGELGLRFLGISCYLQATTQVPAETQAFSSPLDNRSGVSVFVSVSMSVWGMMTLTYFPGAWETWRSWHM